MRTIILIIASLIWSSNSYANTAADSLKQKLLSIASMQASFSQSVTDELGNTLFEAEGKLVVAQPNRLYWEVLPPNENILIADGEALWIIDPFAEQVTAMSQQEAVQNNPIVLLTDPVSDSWEQFSIEQNQQHFVVYASDPQAHIASLSFDFNGRKLIAMQIRDRQGQLSEFAFSNVQLDIKPNDSLFNFSLPQGYDLDDQRSPIGD